METTPNETPEPVVGPGEEFTGETEVADVPEVVTGADVDTAEETEPKPEPKEKAEAEEGEA